MGNTSFQIAVERYPLASAFVISRGAKTEAAVVVVTLQRDGIVGRGECVPYARYGESLENVYAALESVRAQIEAGADRTLLQSLLPAGAARNALDCALWDLDAKRLELRAWDLAGLHRISPATTAYTLSVGTPETMFEAARKAADRPLLKIKLAGDGDPERLQAVRKGAPDADLIVDANEAWREDQLESHLKVCADLGVLLVEQPLPAGCDSALANIAHLVPICADESVHTRDGLKDLRTRYDAINIKLDKTGGLTEALLVADEAERLGFALFVGCMVGTSLGMAPALLLTARARFVDLDGPLLLAADRDHGLRYEGSIVYPPSRELWG